MLHVLGFVAFPVLAGIAGGALAAFRPPGPRLASAVQHFAAGVVFAAVAVEILPGMSHGAHLSEVVVGFVVGVALMLTLGAWERRAEQAAEASAAFPTAALIAVGLDLVIDGFLIGVGFIAGEKEGLLLTFALTLEVLFLGLSVAALLGRSGATAGTILLTTGGLSLLTAVGAVASATIGPSLSPPMLVGVLSFGCAALLYLVTEELLVEAHEATPDSSWRTAMFFVGFLLVILLDLEGAG
ncbi:MAG: hypothetical protein P8R42_18160 [Candidatus Binatia bacterium]|nr:hypothetical protein [Candidatus Binatia bacterium]